VFRRTIVPQTTLCSVKAEDRDLTMPLRLGLYQDSLKLLKQLAGTLELPRLR